MNPNPISNAQKLKRIEYIDNIRFDEDDQTINVIDNLNNQLKKDKEKEQ